ncbi:MAG TPA: hypothetical protein VHZ99_04195 [Steroidobacteraceae bacterium]|jgi:hypothetical protein|nr:hypothetical protein [Steroidobacteraceae bacterium]
MSAVSKKTLDPAMTLEDIPLAPIEPDPDLEFGQHETSSGAQPEPPELQPVELDMAPLDVSFENQFRETARPSAPPSAVDIELAPAMAAASTISTESVTPVAPATSATPETRIDRDFVLKNQLVERYLAGRLPLRGAQDLERFCRENPQLLDEIQLEKNIHAAVRLLDSSGHASPWEQPAKPWWERPQIPVAAAVVAVVFACLALVSQSQLSGQRHAVEVLKHQMADQPLEASTTTRPITVIPSRTGPTSGSLVTIGGGEVQMADLKFDVSWTPLNLFRVTIDRVGQGRVGILHNVQRDSNGKLHIELNSSALGPGDYEFTIDGLNWKGEPIPQAWATITVAR